jgi:hypothetical protein
MSYVTYPVRERVNYTVGDKIGKIRRKNFEKNWNISGGLCVTVPFAPPLLFV